MALRPPSSVYVLLDTFGNNSAEASANGAVTLSQALSHGVGRSVPVDSTRPELVWTAEEWLKHAKAPNQMSAITLTTLMRGIWVGLSRYHGPQSCTDAAPEVWAFLDTVTEQTGLRV